MKNSRVLFILEHFYPHIGGAETLFYDYTQFLTRNNISVSVLTSNSGGINSKQKVNGVTVYYQKWASYFGHPIPSIFDVITYVKKNDIIHTATYSTAVFAFFIAQLFKKKCYLTVYECLGKKWFWVENNKLIALLFYVFEYFIVHLDFDKVIAISSSTKKDLIDEGVSENRIEVIYPVLEILNLDKEQLPLSQNFLYYGRPGKTKGLFVLLKAVYEIKQALIREHFYIDLILSDDPKTEREKIVNYINEHNLSSVVHVYPSTTKEILVNRIKTASIVVVPSITEGFGYSLYEACLYDKKVIISDAGSLPEVVFGKHIIFRNNDYLDLAKKMLDGINNRFQNKKSLLNDRLVKKQANIIIDLYRNADL